VRRREIALPILSGAIPLSHASKFLRKALAIVLHSCKSTLLQYCLSEDQVQAALEMSRRGGHLWIFLRTPLLARECRIYIHNLALRLGVPVKGTGLAEGIEIFPKHDELGSGEFGNAIRGPLGIHRGASRRYWFYGAEYDLEKQMAYLKRLRKVSEEQMRRFIAGKTMPAEAERRARYPDPPPERVSSAHGLQRRVSSRNGACVEPPEEQAHLLAGVL